MPVHPFLIAGGGIAGLAASLALSRIGRESLVLEQARAFETAGAGLQLGPNAVRALKALGAWDAIAPFAVAPGGIVIRDGHSGRVLQEIALGADFERRFGEPYRVIHRADLLNGLIAEAKRRSSLDLITNAQVTGFIDLATHVEIRTQDAIHMGDALIGADGIRSVIRQGLLSDGPPAWRNQILHRALVPLPSSLSLDVRGVSLWLCRGGHVVHYPVSGGAKLNIVAVTEGEWASEAWSAPASAEEVAGHFPGVCPALADILSSAPHWHKWAAADRERAPSWSQGRVTLIGDAAHPSLPYLAQGGAMALEDAVSLARCVSDGANVADAFKAYEGPRMRRTARIVRSSRRLAAIYHAAGPLRLFRNVMMAAIGPARFLDRMAWVYGFDPARH